MKVVFAGPSLFGVPPVSDIVYAPPAQCGDIYRAVSNGASAVGLVDGFFEVRRSPWHKEILWALSKGVPVLGSSSLGALRAAEMKPFGMKPVGVVARLYACGALTADDEVALLHGPGETGYLPLTEALVNIRFNLRRARRTGVISPAFEASAVRQARGMFYKDRTYDAVLAARADAAWRVEATRFASWHALSGRDAKREDAMRLVHRLHQGHSPRTGSLPEFRATRFWSTFVTSMPDGCARDASR